LVRVVPTGGAGQVPALVVDPGRCLAGRGAWLHADLRCLELAERRRAFPRALRLAGPVDHDAVRAWLTELDKTCGSGSEAGTAMTEQRHGSGLEADGCPMRTQQ
jgi:hypothetical protein